MSADDGPGTREVARRLFAAEYEDTRLSYSESDEERAPNYVVTPTGARINRMFVVAVLTEVESVNEEMVRARLVDPSGAFVAYAGQYQPEALAFFERQTPPAFVALSGKARTFQPEDSERVFTSVRPESVNSVDADTRDRWVVSAAEATLRRVSQFEAALDSGLTGEALTEALADQGVDESLAAGIPRAMDHYGTTRTYLEAVRRLAIDALEVVAGEREEVRALDATPDETGETVIGPIPERLSTAPLEASAEASEPTATAESESMTAEAEAPADAPSVDSTASEGESTTETDATEVAETAETSQPTGTPEAEAESESEPSADTEVSAEAEPESDDEAGVGGLGVTESEPAGEFSEAHAGSETDASDTESEDDSTDTATGGTGELGDFDAGDESAETTDDTEEGSAGASDVDESEMYELDEEERREVEAEFDVGFESGADVGEPGEAGIETPDPEELAEAEEETETETDAPAEVDAEATEPAAEPAPEPDAEPEAEEPATESTSESDASAEDVDLEAAAVEVMAELDDGDGADREKVVAVVVDEYGADPDAVEDAIQDALMDGQCYEPGDGRLKAI